MFRFIVKMSIFLPFYFLSNSMNAQQVKGRFLNS